MNNSARLPAKLTCSEGAEKAIQEPTIEEIGHSGQEETHTREKSKICESCLAVSKISAEVEICLQTIVSEYEMELKRLRDRLDSLSAIYRNPRLNVNTACSAGLVARTGSETCDCHLYRNIPGFKDEMRKLGDKNSVNSKDSAIMYYEAAALNGCAESCFKVAMYSLNLDSPESVDYIKAKVLILVIRICRALFLLEPFPLSAQKFLERAAGQRHPEAAYQLAMLYHKRKLPGHDASGHDASCGDPERGPTPADAAAVARLLQQAVDAGHTLAK